MDLNTADKRFRQVLTTLTRITSNLLILGFHHSAFTFSMESNVSTSNINGSQVPPGALVAAVQRGLQYVQAEIGISEDGSSIEDVKPVSLISSVSLDFVASQLSHRPAAVAMPVALNESVPQQTYNISGTESQNGSIAMAYSHGIKTGMPVKEEMPNGPHAHPTCE